MTTAGCSIFDLPEQVRGPQVVTALSDHFKTLPTPPRKRRLRYYDTFDWRLFNAGLVLVGEGTEYRLLRTVDDAPLHSCSAAEPIRFWQDCGNKEMRDSLRRLLGDRALLPVADLFLRTQTVRILNADEKTVVRACIEEGEVLGNGNAAPIGLVRIVPVKGYSREARSLAGCLAASGLTGGRGNVFEQAVRASGRRPGDYTSKLRLHLDRSMTAQQAAGVIFLQLLDTIERNEPGLRADIDSEFLHDFRVSIRRTRAGLQQLKGVLPQADAEGFRSRFAGLGKATNRLRDLDVYLLGESHYTQLIETDLSPALQPLFRRLAEERQEAQAAVIAVLDSDFYRGLLSDWRDTLAKTGTAALRAPRSEVPVERLARRLIRKRHARVLLEGGGIGEDSPDEALHRLRISCKKLRYLLEFFSSLYPPREMTRLIKQLKRLQDNLGDFNDLSVQRAELRVFLTHHSTGVSTRTAAAVGALIATLGIRQAEVRRHFTQAFASLAGEEHSRRFAHLFGRH